MATNIGMMDSAYFVGRSEILAWINSTLQLNLSKVEEVTDVLSNLSSLLSNLVFVLELDLTISNSTSKYGGVLCLNTDSVKSYLF